MTLTSRSISGSVQGTKMEIVGTPPQESDNRESPPDGKDDGVLEEHDLDEVSGGVLPMPLY